MQTEDKRRFIEIVAVIATGVGKLVFINGLEWHLPFIIAVCLFWSLYVFFRFRDDRQVLSYWGLTKTGFGTTFKELLPVVLVCIAIFILLGHQIGTNILNWNIVLILILYPIWGILQQFLVLGIFSKNLQNLNSAKLSNVVIVLLTSILFSIVHYPFPVLIAGTFLLAVIYTSLYLKGRNLIVLGIYHGWLAAFFFYTMMARDPWVEAFGNLF